MQIQQGQAVAFFAFDIGYAVALEKLGALVEVMPVQPLSQKKRTPPYLQYAHPPQILNLGAAIDLRGNPGSIQVKVFDFGAVSLSWRWSLTAQDGGLPIDDLPQLSQEIYNLGLETQARAQIERLVEKIKPAIIRPGLSELVEDYYLFIMEKAEQPISAESLLKQHSSSLARTLRFENEFLSQEQQAEALSQKVSYYEHDLVLVDWNAAIIYDPDYEDAASVLELLNVELLEARYTDALLDKRITEHATLVTLPPEWPIPLRTPYRQAIQELAELRIDVSLLTERIDNSLKLIGDLYLARIHELATQRFYLREWERTIARKLEIITGFYQVLTDRVRASQSHILELAIILLILIDILKALFQ